MLKIFVDFDHTIFKREAYKLAFFRSLKDQVSRQTFNRAYDQAVGTFEVGWNYTLEKHARLITQDSGLKYTEIIKKFNKVNKSSRKFLYPQTIPFLNWLATLPAKTILLTFGNIHSQKMTIKYSGVVKYFDKVIYTAKHKEVVELGIQSNDQVIFVNDNLQEFIALKKRYPKAIFLLLDSRRKTYKGMKNPFPVFQTLTGVRTYLIKVLKQIK